jgi:hypothetical protein
MNSYLRGSTSPPLFLHLFCPAKEKPTRLKLLADGSKQLDPGLDKCYSTISLEPDGYMPQQQQHVIRAVRQEDIMVECLYPNGRTPVNSRVQDNQERLNLRAAYNSCNVQSYELPDPDERLLRQHVLLLRTRFFWHSGLIDSF